MPGFGQLDWGTSPWGGPGLITIIAALPTGTNRITVFFDSAPRAVDPLGYQDATNALLWSLEAVDPAVIGIDGEAVVDPPARRPSPPARWIGDIRVDEDDPTVLHVWTVPELEVGIDYDLTLAGLIRGAKCETLAGPTTFRVRARNRPRARQDPTIAAVDLYADWANPQFVIDPATGLPTEGPGHWVYDEAGRVVRDGNAESLKKRILRLFLTPVGSFSHLPNFGQRELVKRLAKPGEIQSAAVRLLEQIRQFEDVRDASVDASIERTAAGGIVRWRVEVQPRNAGLVRFSFQQPV